MKKSALEHQVYIVNNRADNFPIRSSDLNDGRRLAFIEFDIMAREAAFFSVEEIALREFQLEHSSLRYLPQV